MNVEKIQQRRNFLREQLNVQNRHELTEKFDYWDFDTVEEVVQAYMLDRLEFLLGEKK